MAAKLKFVYDAWSESDAISSIRLVQMSAKVNKDGFTIFLFKRIQVDFQQQQQQQRMSWKREIERKYQKV